jgi:hypothetical protein
MDSDSASLDRGRHRSAPDGVSPVPSKRSPTSHFGTLGLSWCDFGVGGLPCRTPIWKQGRRVWWAPLGVAAFLLLEGS